MAVARELRFLFPEVSLLLLNFIIWYLLLGKGLNVAVSGAVVADIPGQIDNLMKRLEEPEYQGVIVRSPFFMMASFNQHLYRCS